MPHSPLISKIRCPNPNKKKTCIMNRNYVIYIATREGVDFSPDYSPPTGIIEYDNRINLLNNELKEINCLKNDEYIKYIQERPKSHGLFGNIETENIVNLGNQLADMSKQRKCIYRGIISLSEQDALELGYTSKEKWELYLRSNMSILKKEFNIDIKDFCWVAAFHMEPTHPHCHYMFWDSSEKLHNNFIHPTKQHTCREAFSKEIFIEEYKIATLEKTNSRDEILGFGKNINNELSDILKEMQIGMPGHFKHNDIKDLTDQLIRFSQTLPTTGRLNYKFLPPDNKQALDQITAYILKFPAIQKEYLNYIEQNKVISDTYSAGSTKENAIQQKQLGDLNTRLGNQLLKTCKIILENRDFLADYSPTEPCSSGEPDSPEWDYILSIAPDSPDQDFPNSDEPGSPEWDYILSIAPDSPDQDFPNSDEPGSPEWDYILSIAPDSPDQDFPSSGEPGSPERDYILPNAPDSLDQDFPGSSEPGSPEWSLSCSSNYRKATTLIYNNGTPDYEAAAKLLQIECNKHNASAFLLCGKMYEKKTFIDPTNENNAQLYYANAFQGFYELLNNPKYSNKSNYLNYMLGKMYESGTGTSQNYEKAIIHYSASNNKYAQYSLAKLYLNHDSVYYNFPLAEKLLEQISTDNSRLSPCAQYTLGKLYAESELDAKYHNLEKGIELFKSCLNSEQMKEHALFALGKLYSITESPIYNLDEGIKYYTESAKLGNAYAQYRLGKQFLDKNTLDIPLAINYLTLAAEQDHEIALYSLGQFYSNKESSSYDIKTAMFFLERSADKGNMYALAKLGSIHLWGAHATIPKDVELGKKYLLDAVSRGNDYAKEMLTMYDNFCSNIIFRSVFKTALDCFYSISQQNRQTKFDSLFHSTDYRKLKAKHLKENHSQDNELN